MPPASPIQYSTTCCLRPNKHNTVSAGALTLSAGRATPDRLIRSFDTVRQGDMRTWGRRRKLVGRVELVVRKERRLRSEYLEKPPKVHWGRRDQAPSAGEES